MFLLISEFQIVGLRENWGAGAFFAHRTPIFASFSPAACLACPDVLCQGAFCGVGRGVGGRPPAKVPSYRDGGGAAAASDLEKALPLYPFPLAPGGG